jgi:integrase
MHLKHGAYYYVYQNKWTRLSKDYSEALRIYAGLIAPNSNRMPDLIDRFLSLRQLSDKPLKPKTYATYCVVAKRLKTAFEAFSPDQVKPSHLYQLITAKQITTGMASHYRSVMIGAMQLGVEEGLIDKNPIKEVKNFVSRSRDRYLTDGEYMAIRDKATPTLKALMDICYLTGQRIGDILSLKLTQLTEDGVVFQQQKTGTRLCIAWNSDLRIAVTIAKALHQCVRGMTLFHTRQGTPFKYSTIRTLWDRAVKASGVKDAHLHDLRAKAATDAKRQGVDSQAMLGHKSEAVHLRYIRDKETPIVEGIRKVV